MTSTISAISENYSFTDNQGSHVCRKINSNNNYYPNIPIYSENIIIYAIKHEQISQFLSVLPPRFEIVNKESTVKYLDNLNCDIGEIVDVFILASQLISSEFFSPLKIIVKKYNDPETKDNYIAMDLRLKKYPEDLTEKIWTIRDKLLEKYPDVDWILISTDFVRLKV